MSPDPREDLADAVRALIHSVRAFDGPDEAAVAAGDIVRAVVAQLEPHRLEGPFMQAGLLVSVDPAVFLTDDPNAIFPYSPVVGRRNPLSPPVEMWSNEAGEVMGRAVLDPAYTGPPHSVHGGVIALIFDELLGSTSVVNRVGAPTGTLTVRYRSFTPQGEQLDLRSWIDGREGRKIFIKGEMHHGDTLCAEADGIFIEPKASWATESPFGGR
ncbi:MAG: PaaI family thioesterase [Acidimicrobiia bacterium]|nr:PaaI family thioesterase [Acidimicrobiia bacterium]MDH5238228.1 PaaI family thioesterase [Acidimicrobiia bacterium]